MWIHTKNPAVGLEGGGGGGVKTKTANEGQFRLNVTISDPLCARSKGMFMTCGARAPSKQLAGWGAARHHCGAGHESRINPNNLR